MLLNAILVVREFFRVRSKPTHRRPIESGSNLQQERDIEAPAEFQQNSPQPTMHEAMEPQQDAMLNGRRTDTHVEFAKAPYSPNDFLEQTNIRSLLQELTSQGQFYNYWRHQKVLGEGGDGIVHLYQQPKQRDMYIAVKLPRSHEGRKALEQEITNMRIIGRHEHILELCFAIEDWHPYGPAMFLPYCELGDLISYRDSWCAKQESDGQPQRVSEITMWKLFRDMVLALNYLHSELGTRYVHNDFKPANILAVVPSDQTGLQAIPEEPVFQLSDFARLTPWPTPKGIHDEPFGGTPEFAPPRSEQASPIHPSADIWGLGATLQYMALGIVPIQSQEAFIRSRKAKGETHPRLGNHAEWMSRYWRIRIPTIFRPINVLSEVLQKHYDLPYELPDYQQYSALLGFWYAQLWKPVQTRPKASMLVQAIPHMDNTVNRLKLERTQQICHDED